MPVFRTKHNYWTKDDCRKAHLRSVCSDEVDRLRLVLLPLWGVLVNHLPNGDRVGEYTGGKSFQAGQHLKPIGL